ncbi:hypothetical protein AX16_007187 [Volvariella volvacea WC 439]|nr:hypothetical protein AX16_007187 [Volvariella volvacea WC 439]
MDETPPEILCRIADFIDNGSNILALRSVSRRFNTVFTPIVALRIRIRAVEPAPTVSTQLKGGGPSRFQIFHPIPDAFIKNVYWVHLTIRFYELDFLYTPIWDEFSRFAGLKELQIAFENMPSEAEDPETSFGAVLKRIISATNRALSHLRLDLLHRRELRAFPNALTKLRCLKLFRFSHSCQKSSSLKCRSSPEPLAQLCAIIENNPSLRTLEYQYRCQEFPLSLHDIFPPTLTSMNTQKLSIYGHFLPAPSTIAHSFLLPELKHLQHLELYAPDLSLPFLECLISFEGLRECHIHLVSDAHPPVPTPLIRHVFATHAPTLERLTIRAGSNRLPIGCDGFILSLSNLPNDNHDPT